MKKIGLYFGSFNPITNAHIMVALQALEYREKFKLDELWFVVSPQNPHKDIHDLAPVEERVKMINRAIEDVNSWDNNIYGKLNCCTKELELPSPSYTHITFKELEKDHKDVEFIVVCGADTYDNIPNWKFGKEIWDKYNFLIVERGDSGKSGFKYKENDDFISGYFSVSASLVRERLKNGLNITSLVTSSVKQYIYMNFLYRSLQMNVSLADEDYLDEVDEFFNDLESGIIKISMDDLSNKIKKGQVVIALYRDEIVGFCYIEVNDNNKKIELIISPKFIDKGVYSYIKEKSYSILQVQK